MKKYLLIIAVVAVAAFIIWRSFVKKQKGDPGPEPTSLAVSSHSHDFNLSMSKMLENYFQLTESFVNWDTAAIKENTDMFSNSVDSLKLEEMEKDSAIYPTVESYWGMIKSEIDGMQADKTIYEKRESLNMLSQELFDLLRVVKFDASKIYYHECPMALNNYETSAFWLSTEATDEMRRNPYLGLHDPKYGRAMLTCGATRDSLHFESK